MSTREQNRHKVLEFLLKHPCVDCNESNILVLTFDHLNPSEKSATISKLVTNGISWSRIEKEINKCSVRCLNCHIKIEEKRMNSKRYQFWLNNEISP